MPERKIQSNEDGEISSPPKRRIVRRIVRRVPKPKEVATGPVVSEEIAALPILQKAPVTGSGRVIEPSKEARALLADEEPVHVEEPTRPAFVAPPQEKSGPKEMILEQLGQKKERPAIQNQSTLSPEGRSPIESIWPYIAAAKQHTNADATVERADSKTRNMNNPEVEEVEHHYFAWMPWVLIPLAVVGIVLFGLSYFAGAEVLVTPKTQQVPVIADLQTEKNADPAKLLPLTVLILEDKVTSDVPATESKTTIATASGKVTVYNKQKVAQTLIKTTRLEAPDGKIYRIRENVKVPAATGDKPGTLEVTVYAESAGPEYNRKAATDYTIPGFKGKPQFQLVYAKSTGEITGGSSGVKKSVTNETMDELAKQMRIELENKLRGRVSRELLQTQVAYESLYQFDYKEPSLEASDAPEKARVALTGTLAVPVFERTLLSRELAKIAIKEYVGEDLLLDKIDQFAPKLAEGQKVNLLTDEKATFHFEGDARFIWTVDAQAFARALLNVAKSDVSRVAARFTGIDKVSATLNPVWKSYFPGNVDDIKVKIVQ